MNFDDLNGWQPTSTRPLQENEAFAVSSRANNAADHTDISQNVSNATANSMSFPHMTYPVGTGENMYGTRQPCTNSIPDTFDSLMVDLNDLQSQQTSLVDPNPRNTNSNSMYGQNPICAGRDVKGLSYDRNAISGGASVNDIADFDSFWDLGTDDDFMLSKGNNTGAPKTGLNEVGFGHIGGSEINDFMDFGGSTNMSFNTQRSGGISIGNQVDVCPADIDGSFLSLGIGNCATPNFGSELSSQGDRSTPNLPTDLNVPDVFQVSNRSLKRDQNMVQFAGQNQVRGCTSANSTIGLPYHSSSGVNPSQFHVAQKPNTTDMQYGFSTSNTGNLGIEGNRHARYANLHPQRGYIAGDMTASSGQFNSSSARLLNPGRSESSGLTSEAVKHSWHPSRSTSQLLSRSSGGNVQQNISPQSSTLRSFSKLIRSTTRPDTPGQLLPANDGYSPGVSGSGFYPGRVGVEVRKDDVAQSGLSSSLAQRQRLLLDMQGASQASANLLLPGSTGTQFTDHRTAFAAEFGSRLNNLGSQVPSNSQTQFTDNRTAFAAEFGSRLNNMGSQVPSRSQLVSADLHGPSFRPGGFQGLPIQLSRDPQGPISSTGHSQGQLFQLSRDLGAPSATTGQVIPVAKNYGISRAAQVLGESSLKRSGVQLTQTAPRIQRRKIQPVRPPSVPPAQLMAPGVSASGPTMARIPPSVRLAQQIAARVSAPAPVTHIKWEGAEETPQPSGEKCMICKRDLSFTPEGPVFQPAIAPAVAVLPCKHTFHDECLQKITPPDQAKNPPCIPCAIGEV